MRQIEAVNAQTGPVMLAYPTAPQIDAHAGARSGRRRRGRRHRRRRRAPPALGDQRRREDRKPHATRSMPCPRSTSPTAITARRRRRASRKRAAAKARTPISSPCCFRRRDDHPRLQSRAAGFERPHARNAAGRIAPALRGRAERSAGAARRRRRSRHVSRRALVPSCLARRPGVRGGSPAIRSRGCRSRF